MATSFTEYPTIPVQRAFSWSGIFAGAFLFLAIEATFGILGAAVFASVANPASAHPLGAGIRTGAGIWMVVLSIISLYFAGKLASRLSGAPTRNLGMHAGFVTFGMCILTTVLVTGVVLVSTVGGITNIGASAPHMIHVLTKGGYWLFITFVLAMTAAALGGIHGATSGEKRVASPSTTSRTAAEEKRVA
jgi:hypothetical protein